MSFVCTTHSSFSLRPKLNANCSTSPFLNLKCNLSQIDFSFSSASNTSFFNDLRSSNLFRFPRTKIYSNNFVSSSRTGKNLIINSINIQEGNTKSQLKSNSTYINGAYWANEETPSGNGTALVWLKHDLRLDDNPGLYSSSTYEHVLPVFIFDPEIFLNYSENKLFAYLEALQDLKRSLRSNGSDLIVKVGKSDEILFQLCEQLGKVEILAEDEFEHSWKVSVDSLIQKILFSNLGNKIKLKLWHSPIYDIDKNITIDDYRNFKKNKNKNKTFFPISAPQTFSSLPNNINSELPSLESLVHIFKNDPKFSVFEEKDETFEKIKNFFVIGGEKKTKYFFEAFLKYLEPSSNGDWQKLYSLMDEFDFNPCVKFSTFFEHVLFTGCISKRRIHFDSLEYEKERGGGYLSPFGFSTFTTKAAVRVVDALEWHHFLARQTLNIQNNDSELKSSFWSWRGWIIEYSFSRPDPTSLPENYKNLPAILLVHGFGAFWQHYRDNLKILAGKNYTVFAVTKPGFGRSQKPFYEYGPNLWRDFLKDFVLEVVRQPVIVAGNSIGGYSTAALSSTYPDLVQSLILINSAGRLVPNESSQSQGQSQNGTSNAKEKKKTNTVVSFLFSRTLLLYLQFNSSTTLKRCYPKNPERADAWLFKEITRASYDPGAVEVIETSLSLPNLTPLNVLIQNFKKPVLVLQGKYDPLNDAVARANLMQFLCSNVSVQFLEAGHCPHDEIPDVASDYIDQWAKNFRAAEKIFPEKKFSDVETNSLLKDPSAKSPADVLEILEEEIAVTFVDNKIEN